MSVQQAPTYDTTRSMVSIHDRSELQRFLAERGLTAKQARRLRINFFKHFGGEEGALDGLEEGIRTQLEESIAFHSLSLQDRLDSEVDGATRLIFRQGRSLFLESVILRMNSGRTSLCVSCQIGCAAGCRFCATGQMRQAVDLSTDEILDQLVQANALLKAEDGAQSE